MSNENIDKKTIIKEIENRIQFVIVVAMFFSGVMYNFFNIYDKTKSDNIVLSYSIVIAIYFVIYIFFELTKDKLSLLWLKRVSALTLVGIGTFIIPVSFMSSAAKLPNSWIILILYQLSFWGTAIVPCIIFFILFTFIFRDKKRMPKSTKAFTLIEVLLVIAIIGVLASLTVVYLGGAMVKARDAKRMNDLSEIGRFFSLGCLLPGAGAGEYDLNELIAEYAAKYPQYSANIPKNIRDPKTGTEAASNYKYLVTDSGQCALYANLENKDAAVSLSGLSAPTPAGGKGIFQGSRGWNGSDKYFQVSN
ncbi:MAG: type II secretion system protein [Patescibacteria group bacterium]|nr:type II secretion system protein [Patescibacteria group bacterium]